MRRTDAGKPRRHDLTKPREHDARGIHDTQPDGIRESVSRHRRHPCPPTSAPAPRSRRPSPTPPNAPRSTPKVLVAAWSPVTWNDGSLGCPQKGMDYTQALVDGELLMLRVEQALFQYHSARGGPFTYCANPDASYTVTG